MENRKNQKKAVIYRGPAGSGKSSFRQALLASDPSYVVASMDDLRIEWHVENSGYDPQGGVNLWSIHSHASKAEKWVNKEYRRITHEAIDAGKNIIFDSCNISQKKYLALVETLEKSGYSVNTVVLNIPLQENLQRNRNRVNSCPDATVISQWIMLQKNLTENKRPSKEMLKSLPPAIIVDIDGTLAHMTGRGAFEFQKVESDTLDEEIAFISNGFFNSGTRVIIFSGRSDVCMEETKNWLAKNRISYDSLHMRKNGDFRPDFIIKKELFMEHVNGKFNTRLVIDDRPSVCRMWYTLGLKVLHAGNPWDEF